MVRATAREFVHRHVLPLIGEHFEKGTFPLELVPALAELGLLTAAGFELTRLIAVLTPYDVIEAVRV